MMPPEDKMNRNYNKKDTPREQLLLRQRDPRMARRPRRKEETSSATSPKAWKNPSERLMMPGPNKRRNSLSRLTQRMKMRTTKNDVETFVSYR